MRDMIYYLDMLIRILPYYAILWCCGLILIVACSIYHERYSWLDFFVALLVSVILTPILIPLLIIGKLFLKINGERDVYKITWAFEAHVSNITNFISTKAAELAKCVKLRFSKKEQAKVKRLLREEEWYDEYYCGK